MLLSSQGGRQFKIDCSTWNVSEISPPGQLNSATQRMGWSVQAENYWIYQDNQSNAIIFDGSSSRRAIDSQKEIPVGNVMAYTMGRLIVSLVDKITFRGGDLVYGQGKVSDLLKFTENDYLNDGGDFAAKVFGAPSNSGPIRAMIAVPMTDTQLGQGPLLVGTPRQVFTISLPFDRTTWKNLSNPIQTVSPLIGPLSPRGTIAVNGDIWYRGLDGIRSYILARRDFQTSFGNTPMSSEVNDIIDQDTEWLLEYESKVLFKNRLLGTCSPVQSDHGVWHRGLVAIDFDLVSGIRRKTTPSWEGLWTGPRILQILTATINNHERCFCYCLDSDDNICLYELDPKARDDDGAAIDWALELPSYNCGDSDWYKKLETGRIVLNDLSGRLSVTVKYRNDLNPCWQTWDTTEVCALNQDCSNPGDCAGPHTYRPQTRSPIRLHAPPDDFDELTGHKWRTGYEFQPRLELSGWAALKSFRIFCHDEPEQLGVDREETT